MKALSLKPGTKNVTIKDIPEPKITKSNQIKVKVDQVGICGTDREEASGGRADAPKGEHELIIGHEMLGHVVEKGRSVSHVKIGDPVVLTVRRGCGQCMPCKSGCFDMCETGKYQERGIKERHGYDTEFVIEEEKYAIKVPKNISHTAVLTEPMSVVQKAIREASLIQCTRLPGKMSKDKYLKNRHVLIAGLGPIGLLAAIILRLRGAHVYGLDIVDPKSKRVQILKKLGGKYIQSSQCSIDTFHKKCPQLDMVVEAAGIAKLDFDLIHILGANGIYVLTGVPGDDHLLNVDGAAMMRQLVLKNQVVLGSVNASFEDFENAVKDLSKAEKKWPKLLEKMITTKARYDEFEKVLFTHDQDEIKSVLVWE
jgi:glucose 1-dehydrogenase